GCRDPARAGAPDRRGRPHRRCRRGARPRAGTRAARRRAPAEQPRSVDLDPGQPHLPRRVPRRAGTRARGAGRRAPRPVRAARPRRRQARLLLGRPVAACDDRPRAHARTARALPRRAHDRARPRGAPLRLGPTSRVARLERHPHPHDPRHGRGGAARRPGRDHGSRAPARARHAGCPDQLARGRGDARAHRGSGRRRRGRRRAPGPRGRREGRDGPGRRRERQPVAVRISASAGTPLPHGRCGLVRRAGGVGVGRARSRAPRREARCSDPGGRLHPPHRKDAEMSAVAAPALEQGAQWRAFRAVLYRDLYVTWREMPAFLAQVILQPLCLLVVVGKVLGTLNYTQHGYTDLLFPGLLALTAVLTAMQALAFPLVAEFGWTKEIEDRLLAPMPTSYVAAEKVLFAVLRSLIATLIMIPVGILILGSIPWRWDNFALFVVALVLGALVGAGFGLLMGTLVRPERITLLFSLVFTPLLFTGCSQYPWPSLDQIRWFQVVTACNPITYVSEAFRGAMAPGVTHIQPSLRIRAHIVAVSVLLTVGIR